jgi:hypothetical protein
MADSRVWYVLSALLPSNAGFSSDAWQQNVEKYAFFKVFVECRIIIWRLCENVHLIFSLSAENTGLFKLL